MILKLSRALGPCALWLLLAPGASSAADGHGSDLFAGYSYLRLDEASRHGADLALGFDLVGPLSGFVDASVHWGSEPGVSLSDLTLMAGPGVRFGRRGATVVFVRVLAGVLRREASISILDVDISESSSRFAVLAGGGLDVRISGSLALRLQGDYLGFDTGLGAAVSCPPAPSGCAAPGGDWTSGLRASAGVVYRFASAR